MDQRAVPLVAAATYLGRSENTLRYWSTRGEGPRSFRSGRRRMYLVKDLDSWLDQQAGADTGAA